MPGLLRVTVVYGLVWISTEALLIFLSSIMFRSGTLAFYLTCLLVSLLVPALAAGISFGRHTGRDPAMPEAWRFAGWFAALQGTLLALLLWLSMQDFLAEEPDGVAVMGVVLFVFVAFALPISRYFFGFGARQTVRRRGLR